MNQNTRGLSRRSLLSLTGIAGVSFATAALAGCATDKTGSGSSTAASTASSAATLSGRSLDIYCGAGMTDPFGQIAQTFEDRTGCTMNVTYANAAQIQTQITQTRSGDMWVAGSSEEGRRAGELIAHGTDLVKHVPVLAVPAANPRSITALADLEGADSLLIGDPDSTVIGKIAQQALTDAGLWDALQDHITTTTTAPQIATSLAGGQGDAGIVWKENVKDGVTVVAESDMAPYIKTITALELSCSADTGALAEFVQYLGGDEARGVWESFGYEPV